MQILTDDEFKKKYGAAALAALQNAPVAKQQESGLFDSIKQDLSNRAQTNVDIYNKGTSQGDTSLLHNSAVGTQLAANTFGGIGDVVGEALTHLPLVGDAIKAVGGAIKSGYDSTVYTLGKTPLIQGAAKGDTTRLEEALNIASGGGAISNDILGADAGVGTLSKTASGIKDVAAASKETISNVPNINLGATSAYVKGAIKDVTGTIQDRIDHNIATALDLTVGDLRTISSKTGNEVGEWLSKYNLIPPGANKAAVQASINAFKTTNYNAVRSEIGKVTQTYHPSQVPGFTSSLKAALDETKGVVGLEDDAVEIENLLNKNKLDLSDVQRAKEILDDRYNLYDKAGDPASGKTKAGLVNVRTDIKDFIEQQVQIHTGADIRQMNNNVATAKSLSDAITARTGRGITRNMFNQRDWMMGLGLTYFGSPILGVAAVLIKKIATSPTVRLRVARYLDKLSDAQKLKISKELQEGIIPAEIKKMANEDN